MDDCEIIKMIVFIKHYTGQTNGTIKEIAKSAIAAVDPTTNKKFSVRAMARCLAENYPISYSQARRYVETILKSIENEHTRTV